jgi:lysophospholipase L1-like esterase
MRSRSRRLVAAVAVLGALGGLGACSSDRAAGGADGGSELITTAPSTTVPVARTMVIVGDSITNGSETALREQLATLDVTLSIDAEDGRRMVHDGFTTSGLQAIRQHVAADPDLWVIALGTNDVAQYEGAAGYSPVIEELLDAVPSDVPVVWVDVFMEDEAPASRVFNRTLRDALAERGNATVVDWANLADEEGVLTDGIHPSGYGIEQFADMVTRAVAQYTTPRD